MMNIADRQSPGSSFAHPGIQSSLALSPLTIFVFFWPAQSMQQLAYWGAWVYEPNYVGWIYFSLALLSFLFPTSLRLFVAVLIFGIIHYVHKMPYVVNHTLLDVLFNVVILASIAYSAREQLFSSVTVSPEARERIFDMFAPVLGATVVISYYSILLSKLNYGFFDLTTSCISGLYVQLESNIPIIQPLRDIGIVQFNFVMFMLIELLIPILLTFRRTRYWAIYIGVPFHYLLGVTGHWPFSSFIFAIYAMMSARAISELVRDTTEHFGMAAMEKIVWALRALVISIVLFMLAGYLSGNYGRGPFFFINFNFTGALWIIWAAVLGSVILVAVWRAHRRDHRPPATLFWSSKPGLLWLALLLAVANFASPYLGFKTENNAAMYSNLRTEGSFNNHLFMPKIRLFDHQDDLVEVTSSNDPKMQKLMTERALGDKRRTPHKIYVTYFEFRRAVSESTVENLEVTYRRNGELLRFKRGDSSNPDPLLDQKHPIWLAKLALFRPVFQGDISYCQH